MKKSLLINAGLLAAVVVLGLLAWLKPSGRDGELALSTQKAAEVKSIELRYGSGAPVTLEREREEWKIVAPFEARVDAFQVQRLLELLGAKATARFEATGLARYGLSEPAARVVLGRQNFAFGAVNEMSREIYVQADDGVYLLPLRAMTALPKSPLDLVSKQLFAADEAPDGFDFGSFKVERADGKWTLTMTSDKVPASEAGADDINRWIDEWRLASALAIQAASERKPVGALKVRLKNGTDVIIKVMERGERTVLARAGQNFEYVIAAQTAARLLAPPGRIAEAAPAPAATPAK